MFELGGEMDRHPNAECRRIVGRLLCVNIWSPRLILFIYLAFGSSAVFRTLVYGQYSIPGLGLRLLGGAMIAWIINWFMYTRIIRPHRSAAFIEVAHRLRARTMGQLVSDWRDWSDETPGIAALVQADRLFLCDRSTDYEELLLSYWQIGAVKVEHEEAAYRLPKERRPGSTDGHGSTMRAEEQVFLKILYFVRPDAPVRSTRIPFGTACREAEAWMETIRRAKRLGRTCH